nr:hypothetical protein [Tanacetum cinerariifolium]
MSNTNNNIQTQTSNTLHNAIMEACGKDRPPMLAPGNYVQWKSRIKRYIDTKPNHELIHYCLKNPPYKFTWADKQVPISEGSHVTTTETYMETYKNVSQDIRDQLNAEAEANSSTRSQQAATRNKGKAIVNSPQPIYNQEPPMVSEDDEMSKDKEIDKLMDLISLSEKMLMCKQEEAVIQLNAEQADWRDDTDDELEDRELETHYMYMAQIQEVSPDAANSGPIFDSEPV